jgi:hypothetical protein
VQLCFALAANALHLWRRSLNGRRGGHTHDLIRDTIGFLFILILRVAHRQLGLQQATRIRVAESLHQGRKWRESRRRGCGRSLFCGRFRRCALLSGAHQATVSLPARFHSVHWLKKQFIDSFAAFAAAHAIHHIDRNSSEHPDTDVDLFQLRRTFFVARGTNAALFGD